MDGQRGAEGAGHSVQLCRARREAPRTALWQEPRWRRRLTTQRNRLLLPWLLLVALAVAGDLAWLIQHLRGDGGLSGCFPPGAAAQNFSCPEHADAVEYGVGPAGLPLLRCQCGAGYFNTSLEFFRRLVQAELDVSVDACTPTSRCPGWRDSCACSAEATSVAHGLPRLAMACMKHLSTAFLSCVLQRATTAQIHSYRAYAQPE
jgi:hypothetical protein